ncbi:ATP-binding protein [Roseovarius sp. EL26]|uniref:ATP-binding protein n=1 Tax=Roseovarius sp. EL26 TaxID=2126672 RepID=UPI0013C40CC7|nr:ATP-binding protein [Roseovarius sp. EL26]
MPTTFPIDTRPTKELLVTNLTRDASTEACIFDLIDNSIDAARNTILQQSPKLPDSDQLPSSYSSFSVSLEILGDRLEVADNCGGMDPQGLASGYLRFGKQSEHEYGIGLYGVGLNRALFKLGNNTEITTENASGQAKVEIDRAAYIKDEDNWNITGETTPSTGEIGTRVVVTGLDPEISRQTSSPEWRSSLIAEMEKRYARFLTKGFSITVNEEVLHPDIVSVRKTGPFPPLVKSFKIDADTSVYIEAGQHEDHRFPAEPDYELKTNRELADQYGWSIICNDRVIVHLDTSPKTGWDKKWHNEFSGFVGFVHFTSKDPKKLPWNTPKTDVDTNNQGYQSVLGDMRSFTEKWRANANQAKKTKKAGKTLKPPTTPTSSPSKPGTGTNTNIPAPKPLTTKAPVVTKPSQTQLRYVLPQDINELHCSDKLLQLVQEGKKVDAFETHYSALALIRMLFETAARSFLVRHKEYSTAHTKIITKREIGTGKTLTEKQKKDLTPSIDELIWLFNNDPNLWRDGVGKHMNQSLAKFAKHKERMNSAIHHPFQVINIYEALTIRDEVLPVLRHYIEK